MILSGDPHARAITVQHLAHFRGGKENSRRCIVGMQKSVAVRVRVDASLDLRRRERARRADRRVRRPSRDELTLGFGWFFL